MLFSFVNDTLSDIKEQYKLVHLFITCKTLHPYPRVTDTRVDAMFLLSESVCNWRKYKVSKLSRALGEGTPCYPTIPVNI